MTNTAMGASFVEMQDPAYGFVMSMQDAGARAAGANSGTVDQVLDFGVEHTSDATLG